MTYNTCISILYVVLELFRQNIQIPRQNKRICIIKLLSITTQRHCGGHLGGRAQLPDTILEEDHPMTIPSKFGFNSLWFSVTVDGRNLIFGHKHHIGIPYCG
jgi:hypothetical protein